MEARDHQIKLRDGKAKVRFLNAEKAEAFGKMEPVHFPQIEPVGKTEPLHLPEGKTIKPFGQPVFGPKLLNEERKPRHLRLKLNRIRDIINLLLSYPMRTGHDSKLKVWTRQVSNGDLSEADLWRLQCQNPLRCLEGLVPLEMIMDIEAGASWIIADKNVIPDAILNLATHLAVHQLIQTLLSGDDHVHNLRHVMLSTRNGAEKRAVVEKIEAAWKHNDNMLRLNETFSGVLLIDASMYESQAEFHVRRQIAQQLQLPTIVGDEIEHSDEWLITRIKKEMSRKKYLVLLVDGDIEEPLDPRKVGFPEEEIAGVVVLITSRYQNQANDELTMSMDLNIRTEDHVLSWEVFCRNVGNELVGSSNVIKRIAVRIVEECGGHLLAAVLVAKSLKNVEDVHQWELALDMLRYPDPLYDISGFHGVSRFMVRAFINFIWNHINQTQKHCLTRCLFIPDIKVGKLYYELTDAWVSDLLVDAGEADHNLRVLVERSVLLQFEGFECSKHIWIPEDTYAILKSLNTLNPLLIKKVGLGLTEPPNKELWHCAVNIELANNKLSELPLSPDSLELKVLLLQGNTDLTKIPPLFFIKMPLLCILDLSYTSVRELPNSVFELEQLRELYLKGCECFMKLPPEIGKLNKLEKLDLDETHIIHLPEEIQELTNLEKLILCFYEYRGKKSKQYTCSTIIPPGVISKLKGLQYLSIDVNPDDERWHENVQVILPEVLELMCLRTLNLYIPQIELLKLIPAHIFELNFRFIVGRHIQRIISGTPTTDEAKFKQSDCSCKFVKGMDVPGEIKMLVRHSKALFLDRHMNMKSLSEFEMMNLEQIRVCILAECKEMQAIVDERHSYRNEDILPHLLYLSISYMKNLRSIWKGPIPSSCSFGVLKSLALQYCPKLTTVFTLDFLGNLSLLKELIVKDCLKVNTLVSDGSSKLKAEIFLPKLRKVLLLHLPELTNISNGLLIGPNLEYIGICNCRKLQKLSKMELSSQKLMVIKGETKWWDALKWSKLEWGRPCQPSKFNHIFSSIKEEADLMTQFGAYGKEDIDKCPVFEGESSLPLGDAMQRSKSLSVGEICPRNQKNKAFRSRPRPPSCEKEPTNEGAWTKEEDERLVNYIKLHGEGCWRSLPKAAGLPRSGKSCRLRWINYLRPDLKRGNFTNDEEELIIKFHSLLGNRWPLIASRLTGRTDNEIRNYWNTHIKRKLYSLGIDPQTHRPLNTATATPTKATPPSNPTAAASPSTPTAATSSSNPAATASPSIAMPTWEMICDHENMVGNSF